MSQFTQNLLNDNKFHIVLKCLWINCNSNLNTIIIK